MTREYFNSAGVTGKLKTVGGEETTAELEEGEEEEEEEDADDDNDDDGEEVGEREGPNDNGVGEGDFPSLP